MGQEYPAKCLDCGHDFTISEGGGFVFHMLRSNTCGKEKTVGFDELEHFCQ